MNNIYILLLALLIQGCAIGASVVGNATAIIDNPLIGSKKGVIQLKSNEEPVLTSEKLKKLWGEPNFVYNDKNFEYWDYNVGIRWKGLKFIIILVPIPLEIPVGYDHMIFKMQNDMATQVTIQYDEFLFGGLCGYIPDPHNLRWFCETHSLDEEKKNNRYILNDFYGTSDDFKWFDNDIKK